jgi:putative transposase
MADAYTQLIAHIVFSTLARAPVLIGDSRDQVYAYMGGIIRNLGGKSIAMNGADDHVHVLTYFPSRISVAEFTGKLKANSSKWIHEEKVLSHFKRWQSGYSAFTVDFLNIPRLKTYLANQQEHHRKITFKEEVITALQEAGIEYDERYLWD